MLVLATYTAVKDCQNQRRKRDQYPRDKIPHDLERNIPLRFIRDIPLQREIDALRQKRTDPERDRIPQTSADNHFSRGVIRGRKSDDRPFHSPRQLYPRPYPFDFCHFQPERIRQKRIH